MTETQPFSLDLVDEQTLQGLVTLPDRSEPRPAILVCHGFKGFMEWGFFPHLAQLLADRGFTVIRFNMSSSGMQPGGELVTDTEAFRKATISQDVAELLTVLEAAERIAPGRVDPERIGLIGHSRGGGAAIIAASREPWRDRLRALVTWAAVSTFDRLSPEETSRWRSQGEVTVVNARTGQELAMDIAFLDDLETRGTALAPLAAAAERRAPWLVIHGDDDESVPVDEGRSLAERAAPPTELLLIEDGTHTLGAQHPFAGPTPQLIAALDATQVWFRRHLG